MQPTNEPASDPLDDPNNPMWDRMSRLLGRASEGERLAPHVEEVVTRFMSRVEAWESKQRERRGE